MSSGRCPAKAPPSPRPGGCLFGWREVFLECHYFPTSAHLMTSASSALSLPAFFRNLKPWHFLPKPLHLFLGQQQGWGERDLCPRHILEGVRNVPAWNGSAGEPDGGERQAGSSPWGRSGKMQHFKHQYWSSVNEDQMRWWILKAQKKLAAGLKPVTRTT